MRLSDRCAHQEHAYEHVHSKTVHTARARRRHRRVAPAPRAHTLAFGLTDSPAGLAAWIVEKFRAWTDCGGNPENAVGRDEMLANISLYWFTGCIGASFWPYYARMHGPWPIPEGSTVDVPAGYAEFPREILRPPRSLAEKTYTDIRRWSVMKKGGHFAALEQPDALAHEIVEFFRALR
jgi:microsomal epoxide hydrolase